MTKGSRERYFRPWMAKRSAMEARQLLIQIAQSRCGVGGDGGELEAQRGDRPALFLCGIYVIASAGEERGWVTPPGGMALFRANRGREAGEGE